MSSSFDGVELPNPGKFSPLYPTLTKERQLLSGRISVQTSTEVGFGITVEGMATEEEFALLLAKVGVYGTLDYEGREFTNCVISGNIEVRESDNPDRIHYRISFVRHTA